MGNTTSSFSDSNLDKYKILKQLEQGDFGVIYKCLDTETNKIVAIKKKCWGIGREVTMLKTLMDHKLDQCNIVKFYDGFWRSRCLVFEKLDISLSRFLSERKTVVHLRDISTVIRQLAVAFDALKQIGVIHADVKTENIMLVDRVRQPFRVKLIDFDMAIFRCEAKQSKFDHGTFYSAPEIMLGLPFTEAIDMWSLGCVMAKMVVGLILFPGRNDYELLRYIVDLLGPPPDHVINAGRKSRDYFTKTASQHWTLMEFLGWGITDNRRYTFRSLDEMITMRLEENKTSEADEMSECIDLLKAMLKWDAAERINPREVLAHPFITRSYLNNTSSLNNCDNTQSTESSPSQAAAPETNEEAEPSMNQEVERGFWESTNRPSGVIMVKPAPRANRIPLEETDADSYPARSRAHAPTCAWVFSGNSGFLPQSKDM